MIDVAVVVHVGDDGDDDRIADVEVAVVVLVEGGEARKHVGAGCSAAARCVVQ